MIGKRLKAARKAAHITQTELAKRAGIDELTVSRISHYETETHSPNFQQACRFAEVLDIPECYLYCRDDVIAEQLLALHKRHKKFRLLPSEIGQLEKCEIEIKQVLETVSQMLNKRNELLIDDDLPTSLKP